METIRVKRGLWYDLLRTALGEVAFTTEGIDDLEGTIRRVEDTEEMDDLFVGHTYLSAVIGMVVQASFGIDIRWLAATDPADLFQGRELDRATGIQGVLESDFFAWPSEVGGIPLLQTLARRRARFNWVAASPNTAANLYETVIPAMERRQLGEYYTPVWLARVMVQELVDDTLNQRVLDPACGSGTFLAEAAAHFIAAAEDAHWAAKGGPPPPEGCSDRHIHSPCRGTSGPGGLDGGRTTGHQIRSRVRVRCVHVHSCLSGRLPATAIPHRGYVR